MKKLITLIVLVLTTCVGFAQVESSIKKAGNFYELSDLWVKDSVSVKLLLNTYKIDITNLDSVRFFKDFKLNQTLHNEFTYDSYVYIQDKKTGVVTLDNDLFFLFCIIFNFNYKPSIRLCLVSSS
jgi:hypothetical protein